MRNTRRCSGEPVGGGATYSLLRFLWTNRRRYSTRLYHVPSHELAGTSRYQIPTATNNYQKAQAGTSRYQVPTATSRYQKVPTDLSNYQREQAGTSRYQVRTDTSRYPVPTGSKYQKVQTDTGNYQKVPADSRRSLRCLCTECVLRNS